MYFWISSFIIYASRIFLKTRQQKSNLFSKCKDIVKHRFCVVNINIHKVWRSSQANRYVKDVFYNMYKATSFYLNARTTLDLQEFKFIIY